MCVHKVKKNHDTDCEKSWFYLWILIVIGINNSSPNGEDGLLCNLYVKLGKKDDLRELRKCKVWLWKATGRQEEVCLRIYIFAFTLETKIKTQT